MLKEKPEESQEAQVVAQVGGEIEAWCGACRGETTHRVLAKIGKKLVARVECSCGARHRYRLAAGEMVEIKAKAKAARDAAKLAKQAIEVAEILAAEAKRPRPLAERIVDKAWGNYFPETRYAAGEVIVHPVYGAGEVLGAAAFQKIRIEFDAGVKILVHGRSPRSPLRLAYLEIRA